MPLGLQEGTLRLRVETGAWPRGFIGDELRRDAKENSNVWPTYVASIVKPDLAD